MKKSPSFFSSLTSPTLKGSQLILYISSTITQILKSSRGRYKIFGIIQYLAALYKDCKIDYLNSYRIREWPRNVRNSVILQDSVKTGRKVFRLLRWIEEIGSIDKNLRKATELISVLKFLRHLIGIFYYICDNLVWVAEAGVTHKYISGMSWKWENTKNILSLIRYFLLMIITVLKAKKYNRMEEQASTEMKTRSVLISQGNGAFDMMTNLYRVRIKRRHSYLSLMKNLLRILMLYRVLNLPGFIRLSMVFHDICGAVSYALGVAKILALQQSAGLVSKQPKSRGRSQIFSVPFFASD